MSDPVSHYVNLVATHDFVFVVFFRGHWCPFCMSYLRSLASLAPSISAAGGCVLAVTSEPAEHTAATRAASGYTGELLVDTENKLAAELKRNGKAEVAISSHKGYEHGMAQPAVLVVRKGMELVYSWAIAPGVMNLGGAKDRPDLKQVWENAEAKMEGRKVVHEQYRLQSIGGLLWQKVFG